MCPNIWSESGEQTYERWCEDESQSSSVVIQVWAHISRWDSFRIYSSPPEPDEARDRPNLAWSANFPHSFSIARLSRTIYHWILFYCFRQSNPPRRRSSADRERKKNFAELLRKPRSTALCALRQTIINIVLNVWKDFLNKLLSLALKRSRIHTVKTSPTLDSYLRCCHEANRVCDWVDTKKTQQLSLGSYEFSEHSWANKKKNSFYRLVAGGGNGSSWMGKLQNSAILHIQWRWREWEEDSREPDMTAQHCGVLDKSTIVGQSRPSLCVVMMMAWRW